MKKMKKLVVVMLVLSLIVAMVGCSSAPSGDSQGGAGGDQEKYVIRAGIGLNDQHPQFKGLEVFKEYVERESNGRIEVQLFHSSQLGDDIQMMEALQLGSQEVTCPSSAPITSIDKRFMIFDLPFLFPTEEVASDFVDGPLGQELLDGLEEHGLVGLAYWENGYRHLTNNVREVQTPADMNGLKIRTMENQVHLDFFRALGANPTPMPFGELFTAMQQGVVDGQENPVPTIYLQNYPEVQKYTTLTGHVYSPFVLLMSKIFWDGLPADLQEVVEDGALVARDEQRRISREYTEELTEGLREAGMTVTELTPEQQRAFQEATSSTVEKFRNEIGAEYVEEVLAEIERLSNR
ncbi:tripartite ATP-independent periplasmic transporter solute receptor, DctP family [Clostridium aceticum]|uniref:Tripartite ATP-independent periplasmic transporter solute receptor, DctP family n=1 Tax=Clostridium aceticum TaxID=84022 RepID=A0A0G3W8H0_9CLOT|nr:TRAP transporter substrate-binding protein [Clostridium aceticum]AKL94160.1 tripartite ATP-independent periplasmic transporter solute receptor, DctP family [Clostridium aceticum]